MIEHKINNVVHDSTGCIPFEIMFAKPGKNPNPDISKIADASAKLQKTAEMRKTYFDRDHSFKKLTPGTRVYVMTHNLSSKVDDYNAKLRLSGGQPLYHPEGIFR